MRRRGLGKFRQSNMYPLGLTSVQFALVLIVQSCHLCTHVVQLSCPVAVLPRNGSYLEISRRRLMSRPKISMNSPNTLIAQLMEPGDMTGGLGVDSIRVDVAMQAWRSRDGSPAP